MAVTRTDGTGATGTATSVDYTGLTVPAGATGLVFAIGFAGNPGAVSGTVDWDNAGTPQAMTQQGSTQDILATRYLMVFALLSPTAGNLTLNMAWTNSVEYRCVAVAYEGGLTSGLGSAFPGIQQPSDNGALATATVASASGHLPFGTVIGTSLDLTALDTNIVTNNTGAWAFGAEGIAGDTSVALDWTCAPGGRWAVTAFDVAASGAGGNDLNVGPGAIGEPVIGGSTF